MVENNTKQYDRSSRAGSIRFWVEFSFREDLIEPIMMGIVSRLISKYLQVAARPSQDEIWLIGSQFIVFDSTPAASKCIVAE